MNTYSKYHSKWEVAFDNKLQHVVIQKPKPKALYVLTIIVILLGTIISALGFFYTSGNGAVNFTNQYGDVVKLYGTGIYSADSYFRAPIFRGTDLSIIVLAIPFLTFSLWRDTRKTSVVSRMMLVSALFIMVYFSSSIAFGVHYNSLHLLYIALFSASLFAFIVGMMQLDADELESHMQEAGKIKGLSSFLFATGIALGLAWLPDILSAAFSSRPILMIEHYTTEVTHVLDLGLIAPAVFLCYYFIRHEKPIGYAMLDILLTLCIFIGCVLPLQTLFQLNAGIELPVVMIITKVGIFSVLAIFGLYYKLRLMALINQTTNDQIVKY
jgi:hypothetical protein